MNIKAKTMTWQDSIDRCAELIEKDRLYGHRLEYNQGDFVISYDGFEGTVIHKEFLYENDMDGVWYINVQSYSEIRTFTNPHELRKIHALTRR